MSDDDIDAIHQLPVHQLPIEPELDLHTFAPADIPSVVDDYVREAHAAGFSTVRLVHGRGRGIQRGIVQAALERHPLVIEFWDDGAAHLGATFARLLPLVAPRGTPVA